MNEFHPGSLLNALVYAALGIVIFAIAFVIVEDKNIALAVLVGAMSIGMCIIIAAAVH